MTLWTWIALLLVVALGVVVWKKRRHSATAEPRAGGGRKGRPHAELDTVQAWEPHATRVLSRGEREAYGVLVRALPDHMVFAQMPLSRFLKVPTRHSYAEWVKRVGSLSADLVVCDRTSEVVAAVEIRTSNDSERSQQRLDRMRRVLKAAGVTVLVWHEDDLPSPAEARQQLFGEDAEVASAVAASSTSVASAASAAALLEELKREDAPTTDFHDPPPSTWFDDFDDQPQGTSQQASNEGFRGGH